MITELGSGYFLSKRIESPGHFSFEPFFFLNPQFLSLSSASSIQHHYWLEDNRKICQGHFAIQQNAGDSMFRGISTPFSGFQFAPGVQTEIREKMLQAILSDLGKNAEIEIRLAPNCYYNSDAMFIDLLTDFKFKQTIIDFNHHLKVGHRPFRDGVDQANKNKLNKAQKDGISFSFHDATHLEAAYQLIEKNRQAKGYPLSMTFDQLSQAFSAFSNKYYLSVGQFGESLASVIISIRVTSRILYNFYMADNYDYRSYSPLVAHNDFIYSWAQKQGYELIDLGTSSENGIRNEGLSDFKKHLGGIETNKIQILRRP